MFLKIQRLTRRGASDPPTVQVEALDPTIIQRIVPVDVQGHDGPACELHVNAERPLQCTGSVDDMLAAIEKVVDCVDLTT